MKLELYNPSIFKDVFDTISHIVDECKLEFTNLGLTINALDKSHITFISLDFKYDLFDSYQVPDNETLFGSASKTHSGKSAYQMTSIPL